MKDDFVSVTKITGGVLKTTSVLSEEVKEVIVPIRENALKRFPTAFLLTVTFGFTTTAFGIENILAQYDILTNNPWYIFGVGIITLVLTGSVYKKLG